jgi:hypothetical protein
MYSLYTPPAYGTSQTIVHRCANAYIQSIKDGSTITVYLYNAINHNLFAFVHTQTKELVGVLNGSSISANCEVVISPPAVYLQGVAASIRPDIAISAQVYMYCVISMHTYCGMFLQ